jgi:hypothetical protein
MVEDDHNTLWDTESHNWDPVYKPFFELGLDVQKERVHKPFDTKCTLMTKHRIFDSVALRVAFLESLG